jgi:putative ABC transport system permease protein
VSYYLVGSEPVTWPQIRQANRRGVSVLSRSVVLAPPSLAERTLDGVPPPQPPQDALAAYATFGLVAALALLEVGLLAGAAFAVGAKSQVRELALLGASGADAPTVRSVVTSGGLWLGSIAVLSGAALGLCSAAAVVHWVRSVGSARFPGLHPDVPLTLVAMVLGLVCCLLAALGPANQVARQAALGALKSGRAPAGNGKRTTVAGAVLLLVAGALLAGGWLLGESATDPDRKAGQLPLVTSLLIAGAMLAVVALVLLAGYLVSLLTARTGMLPLSLRMAARDSVRNRGRTVPAVAAVLAAATLASAALVLSASQQAVMRENHAAEQDRTSAALAQVYRIQAMGFYVEPGADRTGSELLWIIVGTSALITLSAAGITTGLALADARADHMTLAGVGAPPRLRKAWPVRSPS